MGSNRMLCSCITRHWEFLWLVFAGIVICYTLRVNMSVAAQSMMKELDWTENQRGSVLSSFYWGYALGQIPSSFLMMRGTFSPMWTFGLAILIPSILTMLVPVCARYSYEMALAIRMAIGFVESATFPACYQFYVVWIPPQIKTYMIAVMLSGTYVGEIIGFSLSGVLVENTIMIGQIDIGHWPSVFYIFGMLGVIWFPVWCIYAYESPEVHPAITQEELQFIRGGYDRITSERLKSTAEMLDPTVMTGELSDAIKRSFSRSSADPSSGPRANSISNKLHSSDIGTDSNNSLTAKLLRDPELLSAQDNRIHPSKDSPLHAASRMHSKNFEINRDSEYSKGQDTSLTATDKHDVDYEAVEFTRIPWIHILKHPMFWNLMYSAWCIGFMQFLLLSDIPFYLEGELGFSAQTAGVLATVPFAVMFLFAIGTGQILYYFQKNHDWHVRRVRLTAQIIGLLLPSLLLLIVAFAPADRWAKYAMLVLATGMLGGCQAGYSCSFLEFAPKFSPFLNTIANALAAVAGIVGPLMVSALLTNNEDTGWKNTFVIISVMCSLSVAIWYAYASNVVDPLCNTLLPRSQENEPLQGARF